MSSVKKNYIYNVIYQLLLIALPLVTSPYISRVLGPEKLGIHSYNYSIATYFLLFAMLGVSNYGNRSVARVKENKSELNKTFWSIYSLQLIVAVIALFFYGGYVVLLGERYFIISLICGLYVFSAILDISWLFFGLEEFKITVTRNIIIKLFTVVCIFIFVKNSEDLWKYSLIIVLSTVLSNGYLWFLVKTKIRWYKPKFKDMIIHLKPELVLFIPIIAVSLYKVMDKIMIGVFSTETEVGYYTNVESIINIPMSLITALGTVMLPRMSNLVAKGDKIQSEKYIRMSISFAMMMGVAMTFGLASIAYIFPPLFFGEQYVACGPIMIGLSPTIIFISWANVIRTQYLIPHNMDKSFIISVASGAIVNLIINFLLIPRLEAMGAVIGTIIAEILVCIIQTFMVRKKLPVRQYLIDCIGYLLSGIGMYIFVRLTLMLPVKDIYKLIIGVLVGIVTYGGMLLLICRKSYLLKEVSKYIKSRKEKINVDN